MFSRLRINHRAAAPLIFASAVGGSLVVSQTRVSRADSNVDTTKQWLSRRTVVSPNAPSAERRRPGPGDPAPPSQTKGHSLAPAKPEDGEAATTWEIASNSLSAMTQSVQSLDFSKLTDTITDYVVPAWAKALPGTVKKFQDEMSMAPWSLGWEIWEEAHDPEVNPEIIWDAKVRISADLCPAELAYLEKRREQTAKALARYLQLPEQDVNPLDVPTIAMCGSGGGLRALIAGTSSYLSARESGLFDCLTYTAGVSGSCWLQALYHSSIGQTSFERMLNHFKARLDKHIAYPPAALSLLTQAPTNKFLLQGVVEKLKGVPDAEFGLVDVYGLLLAARLLVPKGELKVSDWDLKVSNQRYFVDDGNQPLPIYTAVRHEIPEVKGERDPSTDEVSAKKDQQKDWFQWFEWTPYEFYCEELEAGIPTWSVGRKFMAGSNILRENGLALPEIKVPLMMGIWGSAFCATLSHYYHEVSPLLKAAGWSGLDSMIAEKDADLVKVHPLGPASIPNFVLGLRDKLPSTCPESMHTDTHLRLMDAGMSNNLPIYPLLRPGRDVDVIVAFDVSADARIANWIKVTEGYAKQRGIKGWPMGAGWPPDDGTEETKKDMKKVQSKTGAASDDHTPRAPDGGLDHCTIWVGSVVERTEDQNHDDAINEYKARRMQPEEEEWHLSSDDAGIAVVYFPFLQNKKVPDVDPQNSDYMSTWNFVYTPDEIDKVVALARANYEEGSDQIRRVVRAVYERKRDARIASEKAEKELRRRLKLRRGEPIGKLGEGDHFS